MPVLDVTATELIVRLSFWERVWSLRREIRIPLGKLRGATADDGFRGSALGLRSPGTSVPGVLDAGTYWKCGDKQFVYVRRGTHPVVIELSDARWRRLIVGVRDAGAEATRINAAIPATANS